MIAPVTSLTVAVRHTILGIDSARSAVPHLSIGNLDAGRCARALQPQAATGAAGSTPTPAAAAPTANSRSPALAGTGGTAAQGGSPASPAIPSAPASAQPPTTAAVAGSSAGAQAGQPAPSSASAGSPSTDPPTSPAKPAAELDYPAGEVALSADLVIPAGKTVRVEPGTTFKASAGVKVQVSGELIVTGSEVV